MIKYIIKRLIVCIPIVFTISIVSFLFSNATSDPVTAYFAGLQDRGGREPTAEEIEQAKHALGLDEPAIVRYFRWLGRIVTLDLGYTIDGKPVGQEIVKRLPVSMYFGISSIFFGMFCGTILGIYCARHQYSWFDYGVGIVNYITQSLPELLTALILIIIFCQRLQWFPTYGYNSPNLVDPTKWETFLDHAWHMVIPVAVSSLPSLGSWARYQRAAYLEVMRADYIRTARAKGLNEHQVAYRHALRNALLPSAGSLGSAIFGIFGGSYIIETMFSLPGIGSLTTGALLAFDFNLMLSTGIINTIMGTLGLLMSDIAYVLVDPRIRYE